MTTTTQSPATSTTDLVTEISIDQITVPESRAKNSMSRMKEFRYSSNRSRSKGSCIRSSCENWATAMN